MATSTPACDGADARRSAQIDGDVTKLSRASAKLLAMDWNTASTVVPTALSATLYAVAHTAFLAAMARKKALPLLTVRPWVSILKPIAGADDDLRGNLASFADLDYPAYEILFGLASVDDPAVAVVQAFLAEHPTVSARIVWTTPASERTLNPKVAQLVDLTRAARGSVLVVSDANVRVGRTYLSSLVATLLQSGVGLVSSVIVGGGERTLGAALENAQLGAHVAPAVVAAHALALRPATVGKSMAMRRADLVRVGGWESVADVLAEDDALAQRFDALGFSVEVCLEPIENHNRDTSVLRTIERHARWAKMRRALTPLCFAVEPLLSPLLVASVVGVLAPSALAAKLWGCALALQITGALLCFTLLRVKRPWLLAALEPLRAAVIVLCWGMACLSRRVSWRGNVFTLEAGSKLVRVRSRPRPRPRPRARSLAG
jgi:ceramide glucosyltransferase